MAYFAFRSQLLKEMKEAEGDDFDGKEASKVIQRKWGKLTDAEKAKYQTKSKKEKSMTADKKSKKEEGKKSSSAVKKSQSKSAAKSKKEEEKKSGTPSKKR